MKTLSDRIPYSAIIDRPPLDLPGDARIAVWTIVNVEQWDIGRAMPRTVLPPPMSHCSTLTIVHTAMRASPGRASGGRSMIAE